MKTTLVALSLLIFPFLARPPPVVAISLPDPVLDLSKQELQTGINYNIVSAFRGGFGGGLTLASTGNETCPLDIVQEPFDILYGLPLTFSPVNLTEGIIRVSTDLNIKFSVTIPCNQSTVWKLGSYNESLGRYPVTIGGVEGNPGPETINNWFKIEKSRSDYKLVFCPSVCDTCQFPCKDIGIYIDGWKRRLVLTDNNPFEVVFRKA